MSFAGCRQVPIRNCQNEQRQIGYFLKTEKLTAAHKRNVKLFADFVVEGIAQIIHLLFEKARPDIDSGVNHAIVSRRSMQGNIVFFVNQ